jgi:tetratricopeptide (TPR) repeat protein
MIRIIFIFNIIVFLFHQTFGQFIPGQPANAVSSAYYFQNELYAVSDLYADAAREEFEVKNFSSRSSVWDFANLQQEISQIRMEQPFAEKDILLMLKQTMPEHASVQASLDLGIYYFQRKMYKEYLKALENIDLKKLPDDLASEFLFKKGYAHFVLKEFDVARKSFQQISSRRSAYLQAAQYYGGLCAFFGGDYKAAVSLFEASSSNKAYKTYVPYYICQIQFSDRNYAGLITYAEKALKDKSVENAKEIRLLLGQAYFAEKKYDKALDHLVFYEQQSDSLTTEEFYQIGFSYYKIKKYSDAISRFLVITQDKSLAGQLSNYYMADAYLQTGDKASARSSFLNASLLTDVPELKDESTFHYAKLSAEAGFEREAIYAFNAIPATSEYFKDAQELIRQLLENSSDLEFALDVVRELRSSIPALNSTLQRLLLKSGAVALANEKFSEARDHMLSVSEMSYDARAKAESFFWLGILEYKLYQYTQSQAYFDQFLLLGKDMTFPDEVSPLVVFYYNGYSKLKLQQYKDAYDYFIKSTEAYQKRKDRIRNVTIHDFLYPDALLKCGVLLIEQGSLKQALPYFQKVINLKTDDSDYAQFQSGRIHFLQQEYKESLPYLQKYCIKEDLPHVYEAMTMLGLSYEYSGQPANALKTYERMIKANKNTAGSNFARFQSGVILSDKKEFVAAIPFFKSVMASSPDPVLAGKTLKKLEQIYVTELATPEAYFSYVRTIPGYEMAETRADSMSFALAYQKYKEQMYSSSVDLFTRYIYNYTKGNYLDHAAYFRGMSHLHLKDYNAALSDFETLIVNPESRYHSEASYQAGVIFKDIKQDSIKARTLFNTAFDRAIDMNLKNLAAQHFIASVQLPSDTSTMEKLAGHLLASPVMSEQDKNKWALITGKVLMRFKEWNKAVSFFRFLPDTIQHENGAEARYLIARALYHQHKVYEAEEACHFANANNKFYPFWIAKTILLQADIYYDTKDYLNTRAALEALLTHFVDEKEIIDEATLKLKRLDETEKENSKLKKDKNKLKLETNGKK